MERVHVQVRADQLVGALKGERPGSWVGWIMYMLETLDDGGEHFDDYLSQLGEGLVSRLELGHWAGDHTPR